MYVLIRQLVNGKEWLSIWWGKKGALRKRLRNSNSYEVSVMGTLLELLLY
jgi:hypothetical protein